MLLDYFKADFLAGKASLQDYSPLKGRILRGKTAADFLTLSDDAERRLVLLLAGSELVPMIEMSGYEMLKYIGYTDEAIANRVREAMQFKLLVFSDPTVGRLATWHSMLDAVCGTYPGLYDYVDEFRDQLENTPFAEIERMAGYEFGTVDKEGESDSRFVTYQRLVERERSLVALRAFLYHRIFLRELYRGDGFTDYNGSRGPAEYVSPNVELATLNDFRLIDFEVRL